MRAKLLPLLLAAVLSACAPVSTGGERPKTRLLPGGLVREGWVELGSEAYPLPGTPLLADAVGERVFAAYPYELLELYKGELVATHPLPGVPRFLHASPELVVGLAGGVWTTSSGLLPYPARDARLKGGELWWTDGAAHRGRRALEAGGYRLVVADGERVAFLGERAFFPGGESFPLPEFRRAELFGDLYLLTDRALVRMSPGGVELDRLPGEFLDLRANEDGVWLLTKGEELLHLDHDLEVAP